MTPTTDGTDPIAHRSRRAGTTRIALALLGGVAAVLAAAAPAGAHVSPDRSEVPAGSSTDLHLGTGHGCDGSPTTMIEVQIPDAIVSVTPHVVPGWTASITTETLDAPVEGGHGEQITERDAVVTWTAEPGQELIDGFKMQFGLSFRVPDAPGTTLHFPTIQTCQEGSTDWIEIAAEGDAEPESPAPAVQIVAGTGNGHGDDGDDHGHGADGDGDDATGQDDTATPTEEPSSNGAADAGTTGGDDADDDDGDDDGSSATALAVAGLVAGLGGLGLGGAAFAKTRR